MLKASRRIVLAPKKVVNQQPPPPTFTGFGAFSGNKKSAATGPSESAKASFKSESAKFVDACKAAGVHKRVLAASGSAGGADDMNEKDRAGLQGAMVLLLQNEGRPHAAQVWYGAQQSCIGTTSASEDASSSTCQAFSAEMLAPPSSTARALASAMAASIAKDVRQKRLSSTMGQTLVRDILAPLESRRLLRESSLLENEVSGEAVSCKEISRMMLGTLVMLRAVETKRVEPTCAAMMELVITMRERDPSFVPNYHEWGPILELMPEASPHEVQVFRYTLGRIYGAPLSSGARAQFAATVLIPYCCWKLALLPAENESLRNSLALLLVLAAGLLAYTKYREAIMGLFTGTLGSSAPSTADGAKSGNEPSSSTKSSKPPPPKPLQQDVENGETGRSAVSGGVSVSMKALGALASQKDS